MKTEIVKINKKDMDENLINKAAHIIHNGGVVAFPTETVYGLGADGLNKRAVEKIFKAKTRPSDNPLILHISSIDELFPLVQEVPDLAYRLIEKFWPGPLTLILKKSKQVPDIITAGLDTVAVRMPDHPIASSLIATAKRPIAAPSANISGRPSPTRAEHVVEDMMGKIDMIIDGGETGVGLESTVLDLSSSTPTILRPGGVTYEELKKVLPNLGQDESIIEPDETPLSPGQKYRHYAPKAEMHLYIGDLEKIIETINKDSLQLIGQGKKVGIMATEESKAGYKKGIVKVVGSRKKMETIANNLFKTIREFDKEDVDIILAEGVGLDNIGTAIMNRMIKASGGKLINI